MECLICRVEAKFGGVHDSRLWECPRCGQYRATEEAWASLNCRIIDIAIISGWIREQNSVGMVPHFDSNNIEKLSTLRKPSFRERAEKFLIAAVEKSPSLGGNFNTKSPDLMAISYSTHVGENSIIAKYLIGEGWLECPSEGGHIVTPRGHIAADDLRARRAKSSQAFVAMWFGEKVRQIYDDAIEPAIKRAGYKPMRIDRKEDAVKIDDEILSEIRRSAFIVADFTGHRGGVYFEAGFAMGLDIPIIWTCRADHMKKLHFDIRQYNCLGWKDAADFSVKLQARIQGFQGRGPVIDHQQVGSGDA